MAGTGKIWSYAVLVASTSTCVFAGDLLSFAASVGDINDLVEEYRMSNQARTRIPAKQPLIRGGHALRSSEFARNSWPAITSPSHSSPHVSHNWY